MSNGRSEGTPLDLSKRYAYFREGSQTSNCDWNTIISRVELGDNDAEALLDQIEVDHVGDPFFAWINEREEQFRLPYNLRRTLQLLVENEVCRI